MAKQVRYLSHATLIPFEKDKHQFVHPGGGRGGAGRSRHGNGNAEKSTSQGSSSSLGRRKTVAVWLGLSTPPPPRQTPTPKSKELAVPLKGILVHKPRTSLANGQSRSRANSPLPPLPSSRPSTAPSNMGGDNPPPFNPNFLNPTSKSPEGHDRSLSPSPSPSLSGSPLPSSLSEEDQSVPSSSCDSVDVDVEKDVEVDDKPDSNSTASDSATTTQPDSTPSTSLDSHPPSSQSDPSPPSDPPSTPPPPPSPSKPEIIKRRSHEFLVPLRDCCEDCFTAYTLGFHPNHVIVFRPNPKRQGISRRPGLVEGELFVKVDEGVREEGRVRLSFESNLEDEEVAAHVDVQEGSTGEYAEEADGTAFSNLRLAHSPSSNNFNSVSSTTTTVSTVSRVEVMSLKREKKKRFF